VIYAIQVDYIDDDTGEEFFGCLLHSQNYDEIIELRQTEIDGKLGYQSVEEGEFSEDETCPFCGESWL
jgi:hypothetical protein